MDFLTELEYWGVIAKYRNEGRIILEGGNNEALEYYTEMLRKSPELEGALIWAMAQEDPDIMDIIEERRAIIWSDSGDDSIRTAIMCNIPQSPPLTLEKLLNEKSSK